MLTIILIEIYRRFTFYQIIIEYFTYQHLCFASVFYGNKMWHVLLASFPVFEARFLYTLQLEPEIIDIKYLAIDLFANIIKDEIDKQ